MRSESGGGTKKLYSITEEGAQFLAANKALVDAIFTRMAEVSRSSGGGPAPEHLVGNAQFGDGSVDPSRQRSAR